MGEIEINNQFTEAYKKEVLIPEGKKFGIKREIDKERAIEAMKPGNCCHSND